jgi:hypothetical protein
MFLHEYLAMLHAPIQEISEKLLEQNCRTASRVPAVAMMKIPAATKIGRSRRKARYPSFAPEGKIGRNDRGALRAMPLAVTRTHLTRRCGRVEYRTRPCGARVALLQSFYREVNLMTNLIPVWILGAPFVGLLILSFSFKGASAMGRDLPRQMPNERSTDTSASILQPIHPDAARRNF